MSDGLAEWGILLDSGVTLPLGYTSRAAARLRYRKYKASRREWLEQPDRLASPRPALGLVRFKHRAK